MAPDRPTAGTHACAAHRDTPDRRVLRLAIDALMPQGHFAAPLTDVLAYEVLYRYAPNMRGKIIDLAAVILITTVHTDRPLEFSVFPSLLLVLLGCLTWALPTPS